MASDFSTVRSQASQVLDFLEREEIEASDRSTFVFRAQNEVVNRKSLNLLRRVIFTKIPTLAISTVLVRENHTGSTDEALFTRVAFVTFKNPQNLPRAKFQLKLQGPRTVYAGDLIPLDSNIETVDPYSPIDVLQENESIDLICTATLNKAEVHSRFFPATVAFVPVEEARSPFLRFVIESRGVYTPREILDLAVEATKKKPRQRKSESV